MPRHEADKNSTRHDAEFLLKRAAATAYEPQAKLSWERWSKSPGRKVAAEHERQRSSRSPSHKMTPRIADRIGRGNTETAQPLQLHAHHHVRPFSVVN